MLFDDDVDGDNVYDKAMYGRDDDDNDDDDEEAVEDNDDDEDLDVTTLASLGVLPTALGETKPQAPNVATALQQQPPPSKAKAKAKAKAKSGKIKSEAGAAAAVSSSMFDESSSSGVAADNVVLDQLRQITSSNVPDKMLEQLVGAWARESKRAHARLPSSDKADTLGNNDFVARLRANMATHITDARAPVQLTSLKSMAEFERAHPVAASAECATTAAPASGQQQQQAPQQQQPRRTIVTAEDDEDEQALLPIERLGLGIGGEDAVRDSELSQRFQVEEQFLSALNHHIRFARENISFFKKPEQQGNAVPYEPVEMTADTMRRLSVVAYEPFDPCVFAHQCVGSVMGIGALMHYVDPARLAAWEAAPTNRAPSEGCMRMCVRCISLTWNSLANMNRKNGEHTQALQPPFYYAVQRPGGYTTAAMRAETVQPDSVLLPFLVHHKRALRVQTCVVVRANGTRDELPCVADVDHVLFSNGEPRPPAASDSELRHDTQALPLEHVLYSRLLIAPQQPGTPPLPPRDVMLSSERSIASSSPPGKDQQNDAAYAHMQYGAFVNHAFLVRDARFDVFETQPFDASNVHNARVDLLFRPLSWSLCRLGSLLRQCGDDNDALASMRAQLLLDPRTHCHFVLANVNHLDRFARDGGCPPFATHLVLHIMLARIEFARHCCAELRAGRMHANNYQGTPLEGGGARGRKRANSSAAAAAAAAANSAADTYEPLCKQLEIFADSHMPLVHLYAERVHHNLDIDDAALLTRTPAHEHTTWRQVAGEHVEPTCGGNANDADCTWYQLAYPLAENYLAPGDLVYVAHKTRVVATCPSYAYILANDALLSLYPLADAPDSSVFTRFRDTANWLIAHPSFVVPYKYWLPAGGHCDALFTQQHPRESNRARLAQPWYTKKSVIVGALVWRVNRAHELFERARVQLCVVERELEQAYRNDAAAPAQRPLADDVLADICAQFTRTGSRQGAEAVTAFIARTVLLPSASVAALEQRAAELQRVLEALRCFITSHARLALCVQDMRVSCQGRVDDRLVSRIPWRANSALSAFDLFEPRDAGAPMERTLPTLVPLMRTLLLDMGSASGGGAGTSAASGGSAATAAARKPSAKQQQQQQQAAAAADGGAVANKSKAARRTTRLLEHAHLQNAAQQQHFNAHNTIVDMLRLAQPMACMVREFLKKHPQAMRVPAYSRFVLQVLRVALSGGYAHAKSPLSMAQVVRNEWWLSTCQPTLSDDIDADEVLVVRQLTRDAALPFDATHAQRRAYVAQQPAFLQWQRARLAKAAQDNRSAVRYALHNGDVVLAALRELCIAAVRQDPALLACMRATVPCYGEYEQAQLQAMDVLRTLYARDASLGERAQTTAIVSELPKSGSRWAVFRWPSVSFVASMNEHCKTLDEQRLIAAIEARPEATLFPTDWLPQPIIELLLVSVEALVPGSQSQFERAWFEPLGFESGVLDALEALYAQWQQQQQQGGAPPAFQQVLANVPRVQYSMLRWFYYMLGAHNTRLHMQLPRRMALQQMRAVRRLYELGDDDDQNEPLRPHMTCVHMCHLLGCFSVRTFFTPDDDSRLLNPDDIKLNLDAGELQCNASTRSKDPSDALNRPLMTSAESAQLKQHHKELVDAGAAFATIAAGDHDAMTLATTQHKAAARRFHITAQQIARRLRRVSFTRPCDAWPVTEAVTIGYALVVPERARHAAPLVRITHCTRCGHPTRYAPWMHGANGFSCQVCDRHERIAAALSRCAMCERPVIDHDPVRRERSRSAASASATQQQPSAQRTAAIGVGQALQLALHDKIHMGSERVNTYYAAATPGVGVIYHTSTVLRVFDDNMRCARNVHVCDRCLRTFMRTQRAQLTLQEMRDALHHNERSLAEMLASPTGRGAHGGASVRHGAPKPRPKK